MIGDNLPHHIQTAEDARAFAAAIAALRAAIETAEAEYQPHLAELKAEADTYHAERDALITPYAERTESLRKMLAEHLAGDPDGSLKDGGRIVATLSRKAGKPVIDAAKVPDAYKSMQPDMGKINLALARGEKIEGVTVPVT